MYHNNLIKKLSYSGGFSLLELILAVAIFSLGSFAMANLIIDANLSTRLGAERTAALLYAQEGIEAARSIRNSGWVNLVDGDHGLTTEGGSWDFNGETSDLLEDSKYTRVISVETDEANDWLKTVTSTISWDLTSSRNVSVVLTTKLTNWIEAGGGAGGGTPLSTPYIWSLNPYDSNVYKLSIADGSVVGGPYSTGIAAPSSLAVDADGNVVVVGQDGGGVYKLNGNNGTEVWTSGVTPDVSLNAVAIDGDNNIWVAGSDGVINKLDANDGAVLETFSSELAVSYGLAVDSSGDLYVSDGDGGSVKKIDGTDGSVLWEGGTVYMSDYMTGIAIDDNNQVWVGSTYGELFALNRTTGSTTASYNGLGEASYRGVAVDANGHVWVADWGNHNLLEFDNDANLLNTYSSAAIPIGVSVDENGDIWVEDDDGTNVVKNDGTDGTPTEYYTGGSIDGPYSQIGDATGFALQYFVLGRR